MKRLLLFLLSILAFGTAISQPVSNRSSNAITAQDARLAAQFNFFVPRYTDTTAANSQKGIDSSGAIIFTTSDNRLWKRSYGAPKFWIPIGDNSGSTGVQSGGIVSWSGQGLKYYVTPAVFFIDGVRYQSISDSVTLAPAHPSLPRLDVIGVGTNGRAFQLTGTPATSPSAPVVDFTTQVFLTTILVNPGSTTPGGVVTELVYDENVEWQSSSTTTIPVAFESLSFPFRNLRSAEVERMDGNFIFTNTTSVFGISDFALLSLHIRLGAGLKANMDIAIAFGLDSVLVTAPISLRNNPQYGFNPSLMEVYQNITIPISDFLFSTDKYNQVYVMRSGASPQLMRLDYVLLQSGISPTPSNNFITDIFRPSGTDSVFVVQGGVTRFAFIDSIGNVIAGNQLVRNGDTLGLRSTSPGSGNALWFDPVRGSLAAGDAGNVASGDWATALGYINTAAGQASVAIGAGNLASGEFASAIGRELLNPNSASLVIGDTNDSTNNVANDVVFQVARNGFNRFEVRGNGDLLVNNSVPSDTNYVLTDVGGGVFRPMPPSGGSPTWGSITGTLYDQTDLRDTLAARIITGSDAELRSLHITGTNGKGKLELRHQASLPTAGGQTTSLYANSNGNLAWKNDNLHHTTLATNHITADRSYRFQNKSYTLADSADVLNRADSTGNTGFTSLFQYNKGKDSLRALIPTAGWGVAGNAGTNASSNFIGTTDNVNLVFRTNNVERMRITNTLVQLASSITAFDIGGTQFDMAGTGSVQVRGFGGTILGFVNTASRVGLSLGTTSELSGGALSFWSNATRIANATTTGRWAIGSAAPNASATLDVQGTTGGFLPPRLTTTQRDAIASPAAGLVIYNTTTNKHQGYNGTTWNDFY